MEINWRRTWPDQENDGIGTSPSLPDITVRVYLSHGGRDWYWFVNGPHEAIDRGIEDSKDAAKAAVATVFKKLLEAD